MKWTLIKKWAEEHGYNVDREKTEPKQYLYTWSKDESAGEATTVRGVATDIFNHMTDNKWLHHQETYTTPEPQFEKEIKTW